MLLTFMGSQERGRWKRLEDVDPWLAWLTCHRRPHAREHARQRLGQGYPYLFKRGILKLKIIEINLLKKNARRLKCIFWQFLSILKIPVPHVKRLETPVYEQRQLFKVCWTMFRGSGCWSNDMQTAFHGWCVRWVNVFLNNFSVKN